MDQHQRDSLKIRDLGNTAPTEESRSAVEAALVHKLEGMQSVALQVLGKWGDRKSIDTLRNFLAQNSGRDSRWSLRTVAINAVRPHVRIADAAWVLDLLFSAKDELIAHELLALAIRIPPEAARSRLVSELHNPNWIHRWSAVKAIGNMAYADMAQLLLPLATDDDKRVRDSAKALASIEPVRQ